MPRDKITLECTECKSRNFFADKNKRKHPGAGRAAEVLPPLRHAPHAQRVQVAMERVQVAQPTNRLTGWVDRTRQFLVGVREEMKKVTWPTREELVKATRMIVILSIVLGITIGLMDYVLQLILVEGIARLAR